MEGDRLDAFGVFQGREQTRQHGHRTLSRHGGFQDVSRRKGLRCGFHTSIQNPNSSLCRFSENRITEGRFFAVEESRQNMGLNSN